MSVLVEQSTYLVTPSFAFRRSLRLRERMSPILRGVRDWTQIAV
jgi:hypothetical protein